jgi:hypothetical protein
MATRNVDRPMAESLLERAGGVVARALEIEV